MSMLTGILVMKASRPPISMPLNHLQTQVLELCANGLSNIEISDKMELSEYTISMILKSAVKALDATNSNHAVAIFVRNTTESDSC
ncbi:MAG: helix-turn-helix transcriptional regulator [Hyphomicrobiales bacterium]|nr:helix-turn-helix transcriptional regulator [Hyphomicrobiales bacterium]